VDDLTTRPALVVLGALLLGPLWAGRGRGWRERFPAGARLALLACLAVAFVAGDLAPWLAWRTLAGVPAPPSPPRSRARGWPGTRAPGHAPAHGGTARARGTAHPGGLRAGPREAEAAVRLSPGEARYAPGLARVEAAACRSLFPDEGTRARAAADYAAAVACAPRDASLLLEEATFLLSAQDAAAGSARPAPP
jgi:hypothetical protein